MPLRFTLALAVVLALAACESKSPTPASGEVAAADDAPDLGPLPDTAMVRETSPESTADLLGGALDAISPSVGIQTIDLWIARLDTVDTAADVRDDLRTLRSLLQSSPLDGPAIGRVLQSLGDGTAALAAGNAPLQRLAQTLRQQGGRLVPDTTAADSARASVQ